MLRTVSKRDRFFDVASTSTFFLNPVDIEVCLGFYDGENGLTRANAWWAGRVLGR